MGGTDRYDVTVRGPSRPSCDRAQDIPEPEERGTTDRVTVIGGGLAGSEAAWQLANAGCRVTLVEMRPVRTTPAHETADLAELVCSNSLKSEDPDTATGLLKQELSMLGSLLFRAARTTAVPAGAALAVDRNAFSALVTAALEDHPAVEIVRREADALPDAPAVVATGPLTSDAFAHALDDLVGGERLRFFDAAAPIVDAETLGPECFAASRYGKGEGADYLNCPMTRHEYLAFRDALIRARRVRPHAFEDAALFEGCLPIEDLAARGEDAMRYGPLKPVGLTDPRTGETPYAVVQLRAEDRARTALNLVGFQTSLAFSEQKRVFRMIPGLDGAEFLRFGVMHRNTFIDAPRFLDEDLSVHRRPSLFLAGQLIGTEGYLEAVGTGLIAGANLARGLQDRQPLRLPPTTALGSLIRYATSAETADYQPMHVNFGLVPPLDPPVSGKRRRYAAYSRRARTDLRDYLRAADHPPAWRSCDSADDRSRR